MVQRRSAYQDGARRAEGEGGAKRVGIVLAYPARVAMQLL